MAEKGNGKLESLTEFDLFCQLCLSSLFDEMKRGVKRKSGCEIGGGGGGSHRGKELEFKEFVEFVQAAKQYIFSSSFLFLYLRTFRS